MLENFNFDYRIFLHIC